MMVIGDGMGWGGVEMVGVPGESRGSWTVARGRRINWVFLYSCLQMEGPWASGGGDWTKGRPAREALATLP